MAQTINIDLSTAEVSEMLEVVNILHPGSTNAEKTAWAQAVAKNGLRTEVGRLKLEAIRQQENDNRQTEQADFDANWPIVPDPLAPPEEEPQ